MKSYLRLRKTQWTVCQRLHGYRFYLQLLSPFSLSESIPMDNKICTQSCNKITKLLLKLSVNNDQILLDSMRSDLTEAANTSACINFWRVVVCHFGKIML